MKAHSISDGALPEAATRATGASDLRGEDSRVRRPISAPVNVLRLPHVCKMTGLGRSMIYQMEAERRFPCRIKIGTRAVGWIESEVQEWLLLRVLQRRDHQ
jgi:prophage regulatory protein